MQINIPIHIDGKVIGNVVTISGDTVYVTFRDSGHIMWKFGRDGSFGISEKVIERLKAFKVKLVLFQFRSTPMHPLLSNECEADYIVALNKFDNSPLRHLDRGVDWQAFVNRNDMGKLEV